MALTRFSKCFRALRVLGFFILGSFVGGLLLLVVLSLVVFFVKTKYEGRVYPGIFLFSSSVSGKTVNQLEELLSEKENQISQQKIAFFRQNNGEKRWEITPSIVGFSLNKEATINELLTKGRSSSGIESFLEIYRLLLIPQVAKPLFTYEPDSLEKVIDQIGNEVNRPVQDALFEFKKATAPGGAGQGKVVNFQVSKEGWEVDRDETKTLILLAFSRESYSSDLVALELPVKTIEPKVTTQETNRLGINELLAEGESFFKDSIPTRVYNIILASSYIHGTVVLPGEIFSFAQKIGTISAQTGYKQAYIIKEKKTILEDGGGVCQVSTTLFRAALNAGLPIVERQAHYYRVGFYEQGGYPPGLDATVYPPSPDLKFKNDTSAYLLIQTKIDKDKKRLVFELYGTSDGRKVEMTKPVIHSQTPPPEPLYVDEPTLPVGVVKKIDSSHWGAKVSFTRKVWDAKGELKEEKTFWSNYVAWPAVYQKGVGQ